MTPTRRETTKKKYQISINVSDTKFHLILMFFFIHMSLLLLLLLLLFLTGQPSVTSYSPLPKPINKNIISKRS